jgi:para-nitrobenzyl esterase
MTHGSMNESSARCDRRTVLKGATLVGTAMAISFGGAPLALAQEGPVADTKGGKIRGAMSARNNKVYVFRGIPYAADAGGDNRFMPPQPVKAWSGIRDALQYGARPPAPGYPPVLMPEEGVDLDNGPISEESLSLNVWTSGLTDGRRRPVMVWFHGGGFTSGSGGSVRYDGTNLAAKRDVVLVTVNHRLGVLGFLNLAQIGGAKYARSGNVGMLDIVQALQWVRDNIGSFGGDPGNVTVFGQSGGGGKVTTLMAMPAAKGLFHKVIAESGVNIKAISADAAGQVAQGVLDKLGIKASNLDKLHSVAWKDLIAAGAGPWGPVIDGSDLPRGPFEPDAALSADIPLILGNTLTEATFFNATPLDPIDDAMLLTKVADTTKLDEARSKRLIEAFQKAWPGRANTFILQRIASYALFISNTAMVAERRAAQSGDAATYVYSFEMAQGARDGKLVAPHTAEIAYVFDNLDLSKALVGAVTQEHQALADMMSEVWTNFAKTGKPIAAHQSEWMPFTASRPAIMVFDGAPRIATEPYATERAALAASRGA